MTAIWAWIVDKFGKWIAPLGAIAVAIFAAEEYGEHKGKTAQADKDAASHATERVKQAQAVTDAAKVSSEVQSDVSKLPDAKPQTVGNAAADTAAGKLRGAWTRD